MVVTELFIKDSGRGDNHSRIDSHQGKPYGTNSLTTRYDREEAVHFVGGIYDIDKLNSLHHFSFAYFHGHSVGGTNPSLLKAMACGCFILSHDNVFNRSVLGTNAYYYSDEFRMSSSFGLVFQ